MSWELRCGRRVYYQAKRVDGRVVKTYCGSGLAAEMIAELDAAVRIRRTSETAKLREMEARFARADELNSRCAREAGALFAATLLSGGIRRRRPRPWRPSRDEP